MKDNHKILLHPYVTEKSMNAIDGTPAQDLKDGNRIEFIVKRDATKAEIKAAFEETFKVKVENVFTRIRKEGKHAIIKLKEGEDAKDLSMRIGIF
ncbi:MAG: 50S ribosomal protein L23 [Methanobacteriota archaeon]|nr:MAG: 50S ribosomal protein L23 [Euryarchaeota archaeon]